MTNTSQDGERTNSRITYAATAEGIQRAEQALRRLGAKSKKSFAESRNIPRTAVTNFFNGKPMELGGFQTICNELELSNWQEIAGIKSFDNNGKVKQKPNSCHQAIEEEKVSIAITASISKKKLAKYKSISKLLRKLANDDFIEVVDVEEGSIKLTLKGSLVGLQRLEKLFQSGELTKIFKQELDIIVEDVRFIEGQNLDNDRANKTAEIEKKQLAFTIAGEVKQADIDILKAALIETSSNEEIENENNYPSNPNSKWSLVKEIISQPIQGRDLRDANLSDANLSDADLSDADLSGADLSGADLRGADLRGANLRYADFYDTIIDSSTKLDRKWHLVWEIVNQPTEKLNLSRVFLISVFLISVFLISVFLIRVFLISVFLINVFLRDFLLSRVFLISVFLISVFLRDFLLSRVFLSRAYLRSAYPRGADLIRAYLRGANLSGADLRGANLSGADLIRADLRGANLSSADLRGANLRNANLRNANLSSADLRNANLRGVNLSGANLRGVNLSGVYLRGANLRNANLSGAKVENARFVWNKGISDILKQDLIKRGAIFEDTSGDRSNMKYKK